MDVELFGDLVKVLIQLPFVAVFIWYVLKNNQEWRQYLDKVYEKQAQVLDHVAKEFKTQSTHLEKLSHIVMLCASKGDEKAKKVIDQMYSKEQE